MRQERSGNGDGVNEARRSPTVPLQGASGVAHGGGEREAGGRRQGLEESPCIAIRTITIVEAGARTGQEGNPENPRWELSPTGGGQIDLT